MTITETRQPRFGVNDDVYILDTEIYDTPKWIHGVVEEVGDETILVKWDDLADPTEYELSDLPDIRHIQPTPEGEKAGEYNLPIYSAEDLQKLFIRNCCEGYRDDKIVGSRLNIQYALINQGNMKEWFEWLSSLKIIKEKGYGIL